MINDVNIAYSEWAELYDQQENKTRDLEGVALQETLNELSFKRCLEIGCGTGKNTPYLLTKAESITAVDLTEEMLNKAKGEISYEEVTFVQANINENWAFVDKHYDLITFSLVLEHIQNLDHIFNQAYRSLLPGGLLYIGELHPYKQYTGSKARFESKDGLKILPCFNHHISDFTSASGKNGFKLLYLNEYFDKNDEQRLPRIIVFLLQKF
jgi:ubiquinone/menaquinone biosynthesis C-methylase UbiE